jgi:hypothetical protein
MALTIEDLRPKNFKVNIKGVEVDCKPPRLSHILVISKVGESFQNIANLKREQIQEAEKDFDWVVSELMPELKGIDLDMQSVIDLITQIMEKIQPDESKELSDKGVKIDSDPKAEKIG